MFLPHVGVADLLRHDKTIHGTISSCLQVAEREKHSCSCSIYYSYLLSCMTSADHCVTNALAILLPN